MLLCFTLFFISFFHSNKFNIHFIPLSWDPLQISQIQWAAPVVQLPPVMFLCETGSDTYVNICHPISQHLITVNPQQITWKPARVCDWQCGLTMSIKKNQKQQIMFLPLSVTSSWVHTSTRTLAHIGVSWWPVRNGVLTRGATVENSSLHFELNTTDTFYMQS